MSKITAQAILQEVLRIKQELGRIPGRAEYHRLGGKFPGKLITETFGSYAMMLKACGLEYTRGRRNPQELRKQHFEAVKREAEEKRTPIPPAIAHCLLICPDLHAPYHHPDSMEFLRALHRAFKFDRVVNCGDEVDGHAISFHTHDPDLLSPGHELDAAIRALEPLYKLFPEMDLAESNHGSLVYRRGKHFGLPRHVLKGYNEVLCAPPGWKWHHEVNLQLSNGKRLLVHHAYSSNVLKESQRRGVCMAFGHHHSRFSIEYWESYEGPYWAAFASSLADGNALAAEYGKNFAQRPINGVIVVQAGIPRLIPMLKDKFGRWTGVIPA